MKYSLPIMFAIGTALCWGLYGPTVANARDPQKRWSAFKPYVFIGVAYLVIACGGGAIGMQTQGDSYTLEGPHRNAAVWGFLAGTLGALGAFSLTSAMLSFEGKPKPELVMPIVFGGAVTITAIVSMVQYRALTTVNPLMWLGMAMVLVGLVLVAYFTPHHAAPVDAPGATHAAADPGADPPADADH